MFQQSSMKFQLVFFVKSLVVCAYYIEFGVNYIDIFKVNLP